MLAQKPQNHDSSRVSAHIPVSTVRMMYARMWITFHKVCEGAEKSKNLTCMLFFSGSYWVRVLLNNISITTCLIKFCNFSFDAINICKNSMLVQST